MSQENVETVRRVIQAWNQGGLEQGWAMAADDVVVDFSNSISPAKAIYHGKDEARGLWEDLFEDFDEVRWELEDLVDVDESTVVVETNVRTRGRGSGVAVNAVTGSVWRFSDGKVRGITMHQSKAKALEAVGLSR